MPTTKSWYRICSTTPYRKSDLCIPRNETARLVVPNSYIHVSAGNLYIFTGSVGLFGCSKIGIPILRIYSINPSQIHECGDWETEHYNSVLEISRLRILGIHISEPDIYIGFSPALHHPNRGSTSIQTLEQRTNLCFMFYLSLSKP